MIAGNQTVQATTSNRHGIPPVHSLIVESNIKQYKLYIPPNCKFQQHYPSGKENILVLKSEAMSK